MQPQAPQVLQPDAKSSGSPEAPPAPPANVVAPNPVIVGGTGDYLNGSFKTGTYARWG